MEQIKRGAIVEILNSKLVIGALIFVVLLLVTVFAGNVVVKEGNLNVSERISDKTGFVTPVGSINAYGGSAAPAGWLLCNGSAVSRTTYADLFAAIGTTFGAGDGNTTFNLPDLRGIFPRGAGANGILNYANGSDTSAVLGTYQNDSMQGHKHGDNAVTAGAYLAAGTTFGFTPVGNPTTDGTNGAPRTGAETRPASVGVSYIIKF